MKANIEKSARERSPKAVESMRVLRPRRASPADIVRPTRAEISLAALRNNFHRSEGLAGGAEVWPVLKADAYGHGAPAVARTLERAGARGFCVALMEEGIELREAGIQVPILVMGGYYAAAHAEMLARRLTPVVSDMGQVEGFARAVKLGGSRPLTVHVKVDTGMHRLGVPLERLGDFIARLSSVREVVPVGLMTHFASADDATSDLFTLQRERFEQALGTCVSRGFTPRVRHAANTAAMIRGTAQYEMVRPGIATFGVRPSIVGEVGGGAEGLIPAMRVSSAVVELRTVRRGESVGYEARWTAERDAVIATVPMGYADGLSRQLSNRAEVVVRGRRAPLVGTVSMDMCMVDVTDVPGVTIGEEVVLLGTGRGELGEDTIGADEVAKRAGTISWEVLTSISRRVPRFYRETL